MCIKFIVLSAPRTGSTMLMDCLNQHPELKVYQEPFNRHTNGLQLSMFDFEISQKGTLPPIIHTKLCYGKYLEKYMEIYNGVKILYFHIQNDLTEYIKKYPIVHLIRKNNLAWFLSLEVARQTNQWIARESYNDTLIIDINKCIDFILNKKQQELNIHKEYKPNITIYYENNITDNCNQVFDMLNISKYNVTKSNFKKRITKPINEVIENYDEVKEILKERKLYE